MVGRAGIRGSRRPATHSSAHGESGSEGTARTDRPSSMRHPDTRSRCSCSVRSNREARCTASKGRSASSARSKQVETVTAQGWLMPDERWSRWRTVDERERFRYVKRIGSRNISDTRSTRVERRSFRQ